MITGIYRIKNTVNNKCYIGSSYDIKKRWYQHKSYLKKNKHPNSKLQNSWNKYGEESFVFEVVEVIEECNNQIIESREQDWINNSDSWFNLRKQASSNKGMKFENTDKMKISSRIRAKASMVKVLLYRLDGSFYKICDSMIDAAKECGVVSGSSVSNCITKTVQGKCGKYMVLPYSESRKQQIAPYKREIRLPEGFIEKSRERGRELFILGRSFLKKLEI